MSDTPMTDSAHELLGNHGKVSVYRMETLERAYNEMARKAMVYERLLKDLTVASGIPWQTIAAAIDKTPENEAAERAVNGLHAQDAVDISGAAGSVKK